MLYKHPGSHEIHGDKFDYIIVDADDASALSDALDAGWHLTTTEAKAAASTVEETSVVAEYLETIRETPRRGRPKKATDVEVIPSDI